MMVLSLRDPRETAALVLAYTGVGWSCAIEAWARARSRIASTDGPVTIGRPTVLREGREIALVATGGVASEALAGAEMLARDGADPWCSLPIPSSCSGLCGGSRGPRGAHRLYRGGYPLRRAPRALCADAMIERWRARILPGSPRTASCTIRRPREHSGGGRESVAGILGRGSGRRDADLFSQPVAFIARYRDAVSVRGALSTLDRGTRGTDDYEIIYVNDASLDDAARSSVSSTSMRGWSSSFTPRTSGAATLPSGMAVSRATA